MTGPDDFELDFHVIGAPKSRTTWLAHCLDDHPRIAVARVKENDIFVPRIGVFSDDPNPEFLADWEWYRSLYDHAPHDAVQGDCSVAIWREAERAPQVLADHFPDVKLVAVLRDPVHRLYSHYWSSYYKARHWGNIPATFDAALDHDDFLDRSRYAKRLSKWLDHFPRDQLHMMFDFDLDRDAETEMRRLYKFLDVESDFEPPHLHKRVHAPSGRRGVYGAFYRVAQTLRKMGLGPFIDAFKRLGVERAIDKVDVTDFEYPPIDPATERRLRRKFRPDIQRLERMLGRDLTTWKQGGSDDGRLQAPRAPRRLKMRRNEGAVTAPGR